MRTNDRKNLLIGFPFIFCLTILLFNDFYLKSAYPSQLSGKLSDFSGLFIFPVFIFVLFRRKFSSPVSIVCLHLAVAITFIIWKLAPVEIIFELIGKHIRIPVPQRVKDPADLIALTILPLSYYYIRAKINACFKNHVKIRQVGFVVVMTLSTFAIMATSFISKYSVSPRLTFDKEINPNELLFTFEKTMVENGFSVTSRLFSDSILVYSMTKNIEVKDSIYNKKEGRYEKYSYDRNYMFSVVFNNPRIAGRLELLDINTSVMNAKPDESLIQKMVEENIVIPFNSKIQSRH